jgi:hypothetical protein
VVDAGQFELVTFPRKRPLYCSCSAYFSVIDLDLLDPYCLQWTGSECDTPQAAGILRGRTSFPAPPPPFFPWGPMPAPVRAGLLTACRTLLHRKEKGLVSRKAILTTLTASSGHQWNLFSR